MNLRRKRLKPFLAHFDKNNIAVRDRFETSEANIVHDVICSNNWLIFKTYKF